MVLSGDGWTRDSVFECGRYLTVVRIHYASYRDIGICLNIIGRWPSWNYLVKVAMKGFNRIISIYSHLKQHI